MRARRVIGIRVAIGLGAAFAAGWLIWQAPHCRSVPAHAYYTPTNGCVR